MLDLAVKLNDSSLFKGNGVLVIVVDIVKSYAFSTLRIFHAPYFLHSTFSTLYIFHTPRFPHSTFSTLCIFYTPHSALGVFHLTHKKRDHITLITFLTK